MLHRAEGVGVFRVCSFRVLVCARVRVPIRGPWATQLSMHLHRGEEADEGDTLSTHLHRPLLTAWPYLMAALRQGYKRRVADDVASSSAAFSSLSVSRLSDLRLKQD